MDDKVRRPVNSLDDLRYQPLLTKSEPHADEATLKVINESYLWVNCSGVDEPRYQGLNNFVLYDY
ncbi:MULTISPECIES: hypothetical protein [Shewanella]|uniref:Uncharacterized protein n=1 Tax=Shewanella psychromarinicola TaxID=2487742 RepID=A0A3N4E0D4_9GAMM|nr:hypothetical protein [Shewanella psychromarinicola]MCL1083282.1 hypothetical protein [Shewanella psychromarinicola]RPA23154.1 hypothetical protein EGC77_19540 [Shewanella psychromarinicola]